MPHETSGPGGVPSERVEPFAGDGIALARELGRVARDLEALADVEDRLGGVVAAAVGTVPGAEHASISMVTSRRQVTTRAASDDVARRLDEAQYAAGEGPCLDALFEHRTVLAPDPQHGDRWPVFTRAAREEGIGSMLCVRLYVRDDELGALNLSSDVADAFDEGSAQVAEVFAAHASVALLGAEKERQLRTALERRDVIGQAMGIVMERFGLSSDSAFAVLVRLSQQVNRKLFELAAEIVENRTLPTARGDEGSTPK